MTGTTKPTYRYEQGRWDITIPLAPVPAARPRVGRWGTYYPKTYAAWKTTAAEMLFPLYSEADITPHSVHVAVISVAKRPKKPVRDYPHPDVDNFAKAALDVITSSKLVWEDDKQVVTLFADKRYAEDGEEPHTKIIVTHNLVNLWWALGEAGDDVYDLHAAYRVSLEELNDE